MPFLTLNGLTIPCMLDASRPEPIIVGRRDRTRTGAIFEDRRALKRRWRFKTNILNQQELRVVEALINGEGQFWNWTAGDFFGTKGQFPSNPQIVVKAVGADGVRAVSRRGVSTWVPEGPLANTQFTVAHPRDVTNKLTANQRSVEVDTTGFSVIGTASIARVTDNHYQGSASLELITLAFNDGVMVTSTSFTAGAGALFSVYMKHVGADRTVRLVITGNVTGQLGSIETVELQADRWTRVSIARTLDITDTSATVNIRDGSSGGTTFYLDALQFEETSDVVPSPWVDGAHTQTQLEYAPSPFTSFKDATLNAWVRSVAASTDANAYIAAIGTVNDKGFVQNELALRRSSTTAVQLRLKDDGHPGANQTTSLNSVSFSPPWDDEWHMVTGVYAPEAAGKLELFFDGVRVAVSGALTVAPDFSRVNRARIGNDLEGNITSVWSDTDNGFDGGESLIGETGFWPFAATAALITAWFARAEPLPEHPVLEAAGDFFESTQVLVRGRNATIEYQPDFAGGSYQNNSGRVSFELERI